MPAEVARVSYDVPLSEDPIAPSAGKLAHRRCNARKSRTVREGARRDDDRFELTIADAGRSRADSEQNVDAREFELRREVIGHGADARRPGVLVINSTCP